MSKKKKKQPFKLFNYRKKKQKLKNFYQYYPIKK